MLTSVYVAAWTLLVVSSVVGCRGPRDPDLDRRLREAAIERELPTPAAQASTTEKPSPKVEHEGAKHGLPPAGSVELRTYSSKDLAALFDSIPQESAASPTGKGEPAEGGVKTAPSTKLPTPKDPVEGAPASPSDAPQSFTYRMVLETGEGDITCHLDHTEAPQTVANLIALATNQRAWRDPDTKDVVERRFYDGLTFHRAIKDFIIQTGNPGTGSSSGPGWTIPREDGIQARYDAPGALGMVDAGEDTHGSQFFITLRAQKSLQGKYTPFGACNTLDVVRKIANGDKLPASTKGKSATKPVKGVRIKRMLIRKTPAGDAAPLAAPATAVVPAATPP